MIDDLRNRKIKILLIEDDEDDFLIFSSILKVIKDQKYDITWLKHATDLTEEVQNTQFDICFVDYFLGDSNGLELISSLNNLSKFPVILLTGVINREIDIKAMKAGASDFLGKTELTPNILEKSIRYAIRRYSDQMELKENERRIKEINSELEQRVRDRTAMLEDAKDEIAIALAKEKEVSEMKSRFISMVSHEYRTPLTAIMVSAEVIDASIKHNDIQIINKMTERIKSSVNTLINLLEFVLSFGKGERNMLSVIREDFELVSFLKVIADQIVFTTKGKSKVIYEHNIDILKIYSDQKLLNHIFVNLLTNAVKFTKNGEPVVLRLTNSEASILIEIIDKGIGISPEAQGNIFEPFFREKRNIGIIEGTGLGLAIVKNSIDLLGYKIKVESEIGVGSTFSIIIPKK